MSMSASSTMTSDCAQCLICLKNTESSQNSTGRLEKDELLIERQFSVVYLVNKLLKIPSEVCANYLSKFGNPEEWISTCGDCSSLVGAGRQLFNQIKRLERKHKAIGEELRLKMKVKPEEEEQSILGQSTFEIRHYLDTLEDLEEDEDLGNEEDYNWLITDENLDDLPEKLPKSKEKKSGRKRKIEQKDSISRPKRSVSKPRRYVQEEKFSEEGEMEEEEEVELNLEENVENCQDEDPLGENCKVEDPLGFAQSYFNVKNNVSPQLKSLTGTKNGRVKSKKIPNN